MPASPSLRKRTVRIFLLTAILFIDYALHYLFSYPLGPERRERRRRKLHRRSAVRLREAAVALKGVLIKLAQFMSARVDLLPEEYTEELALLQDQVPPAPFSEIRDRIQHDLGKDPADLFERFEEVPIASASLGQVHSAYLNGRRIAIKVQYPGIEQVVETDLRAVRMITRFLQRYFKNVRFDVLYDEFSKVLHAELDYLQEGRNAERFRKNFSKDRRIVVPEVVWSHTTRHVLTLEYVDGIKINQYDALRNAGIALTEVAMLLVESYIQQILQHRFFHGDPHPGNLSILPPDDSHASIRLVFVDFGLMQEITPDIDRGIQRMMISIIERNNRGIARALIDLGFIVRTERLADVEKVVAFFMERYRDIAPHQFRSITLPQIAEDLATLFRIFPTLQVPNRFILFARTAGMLNGLCSKLNPDLNIIELAAPYARQFVKHETFIEQFFTRGKEIARSLVELPEALHQFLDVANSGRFRTEMHSDDVSGILTRIYRLGYRALLSAVGLAVFFFYVYLSPILPMPERFIAGGLMALLTFALIWSYLREA
ncbi:MAG TPA: AarF/UbiB family protein [Nitrospiria bacterium]|nr:AarF/UbiB family protein [Nitrospiria bacterium]